MEEKVQIESIESIVTLTAHIHGHGISYACKADRRTYNKITRDVFLACYSVIYSPVLQQNDGTACCSNAIIYCIYSTPSTKSNADTSPIIQ